MVRYMSASKGYGVTLQPRSPRNWSPVVSRIKLQHPEYDEKLLLFDL